jgi:hypothetical protein
MRPFSLEQYMPDKTTAITIHVNDKLLEAIDARAAMGGMTRERLVFCDTQSANIFAMRHLRRNAEKDASHG